MLDWLLIQRGRPDDVLRYNQALERLSATVCVGEMMAIVGDEYQVGGGGMPSLSDYISANLSVHKTHADKSRMVTLDRREGKT